MERRFCVEQQEQPQKLEEQNKDRSDKVVRRILKKHEREEATDLKKVKNAELELGRKREIIYRL